VNIHGATQQQLRGYHVNPHIAMSGQPVDYLHLRSGVNKARLHAVKFADILVIDDNMIDARSVSALVRSAFGRETEVRHAGSLMRAKNMLLERMPALIILDDFLPPTDRAESSIGHLRQSNFSGPVIVVSGQMTRLRRLALLQAGATGVVHKDDLNATALAEAAFPAEPDTASDPAAAAETDAPLRRTSRDDVV
jgi:CheY-like chemotaxis protein